MIERLMNQELPYGEPQYSDFARQIAELRQRLSARLDKEGVALLEQLSEAYVHQANAVSNDTFVEGFCVAFDLIAEYLRRRGE